MANLRDFSESIFTKKIRISEKSNEYIDSIRGKKSKAGMLEEIIKEYKKKYDPS
jgi:hypothetical protein